MSHTPLRELRPELFADEDDNPFNFDDLDSDDEVPLVNDRYGQGYRNVFFAFFCQNVVSFPDKGWFRVYVGGYFVGQISVQVSGGFS